MGSKKKIKNTAQGTKGKVKESAGEISGHRRMAQRGQNDQLKADAKNAAEHVKDAGRKLKDASRH
jgi:uncharacterized protein YjbJ (UPF0337 family)